MADLGFKIKIDGVETSVNTLGEVKQAIKDLTAEAKKADLGSDAYKEAIASIREAKTQLKEFAIESKAHTSDVKGSHIQMANGIRTSLEGASNAMSVFGANSEVVAKATETSTGVLTAMNSIREIGEIRLTGAMTVKLAVQTALNAVSTLGIALIAAAAVGLVIWISKMMESTEAEKNQQIAQEALNKSMEAYGQAVGDATAQTLKVSAAFREAKEGVITQEEALSVYNNTMGDAMGKAKTFQEAQDTFVKKAPAYIEMLGLQAQAQAYLSLITEETKKRIVASTEDNTAWYEKAISGILSMNNNYAAGQAYIVKKQIDNTEGAIKESTTKIGIFTEGFNKKMDEVKKKADVAGLKTPEQIKAEEEEATAAATKIREAEAKAKALRDAKIAADKKYHEDMKKLRSDADAALLNLIHDQNVAEAKEDEAAKKKERERMFEQSKELLKIKKEAIKGSDKDSIAAKTAIDKQLLQMDKTFAAQEIKIADDLAKDRTAKNKAAADKMSAAWKEYWAKIIAAAKLAKKDNEKLDADINKHEISMMKEGSKRKLAQLKEDARLRKLDVDNSNMSEDKKAAYKKMVDQDYSKGKKEITKATLNAELAATADMLGNVAALFGEHTTAYKVTKVAQTMISTYTSAQQSYESLSSIPIVGPILGGIAAAAAVAGGLASIQKILAVNTTPPPTPEANQLAPVASSYGLGGILQGSSHAQGGIMTPFGEVEGGEAVINKRSTSMHAGLLSAINVSGGGTPFAPANNTGGDNKASTTPILKTYVVASEMTSQQQANDKTKRMSRL